MSLRLRLRDSGSQRKSEGKIRSTAERLLKIRMVGVSPLGNSTHKDADVQRVFAERIGIESNRVVFLGLKLPVHFTAVVVQRDGVNGRAFQGAEAEIEREPTAWLRACGRTTPRSACLPASPRSGLL